MPVPTEPKVNDVVLYYGERVAGEQIRTPHPLTVSKVHDVVPFTAPNPRYMHYSNAVDLVGKIGDADVERLNVPYTADVTGPTDGECWAWPA